MSEKVARLVTDLLNTWNAHDLERLATFYAPEYVGVDVAYAVPRRGPEEVCQTMALYLQAFP
ncbi:MAG TPA: nuclear transport factor 2 family protein, partial [Anaerolineae bacterium]|nr:nuclear transport factor 2 family protein [Anaerolineae bacterium]